MRLKDIPAAYRVTVKGLARDGQGRLLFVRERGDTWDLPGGGLEHGEEINHFYDLRSIRLLYVEK